MISPKITQYRKPDHAGFPHAVTLVFVVVGSPVYLFYVLQLPRAGLSQGAARDDQGNAANFQAEPAATSCCVSNFVYPDRGSGSRRPGLLCGLRARQLDPADLDHPRHQSLATFVTVPVVPRFVARIGKKATFLSALRVLS